MLTYNVCFLSTNLYLQGWGVATRLDAVNQVYPYPGHGLGGQKEMRNGFFHRVIRFIGLILISRLPLFNMVFLLGSMRR